MVELIAGKPFSARTRVRVIAFLLVIMTAVLFRTVRLGTIPSGIDADEALNANEGLDAGCYRS